MMKNLISEIQHGTYPSEGSDFGPPRALAVADLDMRQNQCRSAKKTIKKSLSIEISKRTTSYNFMSRSAPALDSTKI